MYYLIEIFSGEFYSSIPIALKCDNGTILCFIITISIFFLQRTAKKHPPKYSNYQSIFAGIT